MKKYSILIVDDEENVSKLINKVLLRENYNTYVASDGEKALKIIDKHEIDIVITDLKMPKMSGMELFHKIKEIDSSIKVIIITAFATIDTAIEALRMGAKDYITKPFNIDEIVDAVRNITQCDNDSNNDNNSEIELLKKDEKELQNYIIAESQAMKEVMDLIKQIADTRTSIILYGETGTGKELAAQAIHKLSSRNDKPFIKVNCAAIPEQLLESELFGYEKGAFTGAVGKKPGRFELADGGSIFLDEIGDIPLGTQVKLLRVLQEKEFEHLGGTKTIKVDVRIIAATNKNLYEAVKNGIFREDLYYRLNVVPIILPGLRERQEDIDVLIEHFLFRSAAISGRTPKKISTGAIEKLKNYNWPGNIRELENAIERCVVISSKNIIDVEDLPSSIRNFSLKENLEGSAKLDDAIDNTEKEVIIRTLKECSGNRTKASIVLGISRRSLHRKIAKYNIED
jgi:DNA-binding NtrC family response regulator